MSKVYLKVELSIIVDTDLQGVDNIMDNIDINVTSNSENVDVMDSEVNNFQITDAK